MEVPVPLDRLGDFALVPADRGAAATESGVDGGWAAETPLGSGEGCTVSAAELASVVPLGASAFETFGASEFVVVSEAAVVSEAGAAELSLVAPAADGVSDVDAAPEPVAAAALGCSLLASGLEAADESGCSLMAVVSLC